MNKTYTWTQTTIVNGQEKPDKITRTEGDMMRLFAQMHFLKQAGEDIELDVLKHNKMYEAEVYKMTRKGDGVDGKEVVHIYERKEAQA